MGSQIHHTTIQLRIAAIVCAFGLRDGISVKYTASARSGPRNRPIVLRHFSKISSFFEIVSTSLTAFGGIAAIVFFLCCPYFEAD